MINKTLALIAYCLRWLAWAVQYLVIWPAGSLVLLFALLFCVGNTTPGEVAVDYLQKAGSITDGQRWTWRECKRQVPTKLPPPSAYPDSPRIQQDDCQEVVSDARGYAAYVDRSLMRGPLFSIWILMGLTYAGIALRLGSRPHFPRYVFVKAANSKGYFRSASSRPDTGTGAQGIIKVQSDTSRIKELYSGNDGERPGEGIRQNSSIWYPQKPGEGGQQK